jgi:hypothetical protein
MRHDAEGNARAVSAAIEARAVLAVLAAPPPDAEEARWLNCPACGVKSEVSELVKLPPPDAGLVHPVSVEDRLRHAWETGFRLAVAYGDNHAHWDGEQRERQWRYFLDAYPLPAHPTETPNGKD